MDTIQAGAVTLTGTLDIKLYDEFGVLKQHRLHDNLVVTAGKAVFADRMKAVPTKDEMTHMAVGTNATAAAAGNTALGAEVAASRTALTSTGVSTNVITYACTFGAGVGTGALTEAGIFNDPAAGDMLCRTVFTTITKGAGDTLTVSWAITVS